MNTFAYSFARFMSFETQYGLVKWMMTQNIPIEVSQEKGKGYFFRIEAENLENLSKSCDGEFYVPIEEAGLCGPTFSLQAPAEMPEKWEQFYPEDELNFGMNMKERIEEAVDLLLENPISAALVGDMDQKGELKIKIGTLQSLLFTAENAKAKEHISQAI